jgi:hypothetical protein
MRSRCWCTASAPKGGPRMVEKMKELIPLPQEAFIAAKVDS